MNTVPTINELQNYEIKLNVDKLLGVSVSVNGETILECLSRDEANSLTLGEIFKCYKEFSV